MQTLFDLRASPVQAGGSKFSRMRQLDHGGPEWRGHLSALVVGHPVAGIARLRQVHRALVRERFVCDWQTYMFISIGPDGSKISTSWYVQKPTGTWYPTTFRQ